MKTKSINAVLISLLLFTFSCQKDLYEDEINSKNIKSKFKEFKVIPFYELKKNRKVSVEIDKFSEKKKNKLASKEIFEGYIIDTTRIIQIVTEESINYTLRINSDNLNLQENLVISEKYNGEVEVNLLKYSISNQELKDYENGLLQNLIPSEVTSLTFNSTNSLPISGDGAQCVSTSTETEFICHPNNGGTPYSYGSSYSGGCNGQMEYLTVIMVYIDMGCLSGGGGSNGGGSTGGGSTGGGSTGGGSTGGGSTGGGSNDGSGSTGGSNNNSGGIPQGNDGINTNSNTKDLTTTPILISNTQLAINKFYTNLLPNLKLWVNNNSQTYNDIINYLISKQGSSDSDEFSPESVQFATSVIEFLINNSNITFNDILNNRFDFLDYKPEDNSDYTLGGYDNTNYGTFNVQQNWNTINSVIPISKFVGWNRSAHPNWECMDYAKEQIRVMGYQISNYYAQGQTFQIYTQQNGVNQSQLSAGLDYLKYALSNGIPVIVGVDNKPGHPGNLDNTTDHFIVIVGMGQDANGKYFQFYDNASGLPSQGASSDNKLYYNSSTGTIIGQSQTSYAISNNLNPYQITMIRKSKTL